MSAARLARMLVCVAALAGCATERVAEAPLYQPDRRDYAAFKAAFPDLLEPNYLPFMVHRVPGDGPDGDPHSCKMDRPHGVFVHEGVVYVTDSESHRVRALEGAI